MSFLKDYLKKYLNYFFSNVNGAECSFCLDTSYGILRMLSFLQCNSKKYQISILIRSDRSKMLIILGYEHTPSCKKNYFLHTKKNRNRSISGLFLFEESEDIPYTFLLVCMVRQGNEKPPGLYHPFLF